VRRDSPLADPGSPIWDSLGRLFEAAGRPGGGGVVGVLAHGLGPLAAAWLERSGITVPAAVREEAKTAALSELLATPTARLLRESADGPILLLKGPEVAAVYPRAGRRFSDLDVLVPDAEAVQSALLAAGFEEVDEDSYDATGKHHHLQPLRAPGRGLKLEVHSSPSWPLGATSRPQVEEIFEAAVPSALGVDGLSAPPPAHHAVLLACHAWRHEPLERLRDLLDITLLAEGLPRSEPAALAERWGVERVWKTTWRAAAALFLGGRPTAALRIWGAHLPDVRERTVFENHLQRWLAPYWELPFNRALRRSAQTLAADLRPGPGETWGAKVGRTSSGILHPRTPAGRRNPSQDAGTHA